MKDVNKMSQQELRNELRATRGLLAVAICPTHPEYPAQFERVMENHPDECQWCAERKVLIE